MKTATLTKGLNGHDILVITDEKGAEVERTVFEREEDGHKLIGKTRTYFRRAPYGAYLASLQLMTVRAYLWKTSGDLLSERVKYWQSKDPSYIPNFATP